MKDRGNVSSYKHIRLYKKSQESDMVNKEFSLKANMLFYFSIEFNLALICGLKVTDTIRPQIQAEKQVPLKGSWAHDEEFLQRTSE